MIIKRKLFTKYDETDRLKQMKDSDILAEKKKKKVGYGSVIRSAASGALAGGTLAGVVGGARGVLKPGKNSILSGARKWATLGAISAGVLSGMKEGRRRRKENEEIDFYNDRLEYAKRQALRREKKDWKSNMTQREGYTY